MNAYFEIAYAAASGHLCLFTGTGFSKAVTSNTAPSWQSLLEAMCDELAHGEALKEALFSSSAKNRLALDEAAQVIAIERQKAGLSDIHDAIAEVISALEPSGEVGLVSSFLSQNRLHVITTNYDKLLECLVNHGEVSSICPGLPVPRTTAAVEVYHVHGSIDSPQNMVVTSNDYLRFMRDESFLSRKLSTILYENTVVILGYSMGDANLRAILSDYRGVAREQLIGGNILLVSKDSVDQHLKDYYGDCYGIRVISDTTIESFFTAVAGQMAAAQSSVESAMFATRQMLDEGVFYADSYLKLRVAFFEIVASLGALGKSIGDPEIVAALGAVIAKKTEFTGIQDAWSQYDHLAEWLIYLGGLLEIGGTTMEAVYLDAVRRSMQTMSKVLYFGFSWDAYKTWNAGWFDILASNRVLIRDHIVSTMSHKEDAIELVGRG